MDRFWRYKIDHVTFWIATIGFHMFTRVDLVELAGTDQLILEAIVRNGLLAALIYLNLLVLIPRLAQRKKVMTYVLMLVVSLGLYVLLKNAYDLYLYGYVLGNRSGYHFLNNTYYNFSIAVFYLAFSSALHLSKAWYFQQELIRKMELEKVSSELEYLKAQINPHFLFNSINTIYFQIDSQNDRARKSLSGFSDMLRYQLYECNVAEIPVEKEVAYLRNYVALQRMRKDENYEISFREAGDLKGVAIAPLLLIPFVENAFKHVSHHSGGNIIRIEVRRCDRELRFLVYNTNENHGAGKKHAGIGLRNVRRRLELLYKDRHALKIAEAPGSFEVDLTLSL